jgi:hypothetical protein
MSLGRVGLDFRPMVVSRFEFAVVKIVKEHFLAAHESFEMVEAKIERPTDQTSKTDMLLKYHPIAAAYNQYMTGLNQLRYLPMQSVHKELSKSLLTSLEIIVTEVVQAHGRLKRDSEIVSWILVESFIPMIVEGLDSVLAAGPTSYAHLVTQLQPLTEYAKLGSRSSSFNQQPSVLVVEDHVESNGTSNSNGFIATPSESDANPVSSDTINKSE